MQQLPLPTSQTIYVTINSVIYGEYQNPHSDLAKLSVIKNENKEKTEVA